MKTLVIGATGYIGSAVAAALRARGHEVSGLARTPDKCAKLQSAGIDPVILGSGELRYLAECVRPFDALVVAVMLPFEEEAELVQALLTPLRGRDRVFIFTSGTGVLSIGARHGEWNENTFAEDDPFPFPALFNRLARIGTENAVREAAGDGFRSMVVRPPIVFGNGGSVHIPQLFRSAEIGGNVLYLGHGLNLYSNVHVDDLAQLYCLCMEKGEAGGLYHAVAGEANFRSIAEAIAQVLGCGTRSLDFEELCRRCGRKWVELGLAVNSRSKAVRSRAELGWRPRMLDLIADIRTGSYRAAFEKVGGNPYAIHAAPKLSRDTA
jgi:nucleoside-diphosphate-sugar epimerase